MSDAYSASSDIHILICLHLNTTMYRVYSVWMVLRIYEESSCRAIAAASCHTCVLPIVVRARIQSCLCAQPLNLATKSATSGGHLPPRACPPLSSLTRLRLRATLPPTRPRSVADAGGDGAEAEAGAAAAQVADVAAAEDPETCAPRLREREAWLERGAQRSVAKLRRREDHASQQASLASPSHSPGPADDFQMA